MQDILKNIALIDTLNHCKKHNIDPSGTYIQKYARQFKYALCRDNMPIITITYYKNKIPTINIIK